MRPSRTYISDIFVVVLLAEQFLLAEGIVKTDNGNTHSSEMSSEFASKVKKNCHDNDDNANGDCLNTKSNEQELSKAKTFSGLSNIRRRSRPKATYEVISKSMLQEKNPPLSKECDDEDDCKPSYSGSGNVENDGSGDNRDGTKLKSSEFNIKDTVNVRGLSPPNEKQNKLQTSSTSSNNGKLGTSFETIYEVISKSIMENVKQRPSKECDDEDDCNSEYSGSGNDGDNGKELPESNTEFSAIIRGLSPPKIKQTTLENSRGVDPSNTSSNTGKLGVSHEATYEVISKSMTENSKQRPSKECDDEDDCNSEYSGSGNDGDNGKELPDSNSEYSIITRGLSNPKIKKTTLKDSRDIDPSYSRSNQGNLGASHETTYEVISKSMMVNRKQRPSKECDDEDDCNSEYSGSGNDGDNGKKLPDSNSEYSIIIRGLSNPKIKQTTLKNSRTSSNKGKLGVSHETTYEVISKSMMENGKRPLSKECDDEDDCNSPFSGNGYDTSEDGDNTEKSIAEYSVGLINRGLSPPKRTANELIICDKYLCGDSAFCMFNRKTNKAECICSTSKRGSHCSEDTTFFVGTSFVVFPPLGASAQEYVEVEMSIMPLERSGLLIYNGWQPQKIGDFISLSLQNGFVELRFNCGSGMVIIRSMKTVIMKRWHNVKFYRSERLGSLTVNSNPSVLGYSPGPRSIMSLHQNLLVGGISNDVKHEVNVNAGINKGFTGLIQNLTINGVVLNLISDAIHPHNENEKADPCLSSPCENGGTCLANRENYSCLCTSYYGGRKCEKEVNLKAMAFNLESYVLFNVSGLLKVSNVQNTTVNFFMKTTEAKGLILWEIQEVYQRLKRYFAVSLKTGRILLSYDLGFGKKMVYSSVAINDGHWHEIMINKKASFGTLTIDKKHQMEFKANVYHSEQKTKLYIGGAPNVHQDTKGANSSGFKGCLKNLQIRNKYIDFVHDAVASKDMEKCVEH